MDRPPNANVEIAFTQRKKHRKQGPNKPTKLNTAKLRLAKKHRKQGPNKPTKLNIAKLRLNKESYRLQEEMDIAITDLDNSNCPTPEESWKPLPQVVYSTAKT